jgi:AcrR family transcriptional regulator
MPKAEQTRAWIIEKAAPVFNTKGFAGTSLTDLEKATGLTKGSIYNNFESKDEVAQAVFDHNLKQVNKLILAEMSQYHSAKGQLLAYVKVYSEGIQKHPFPKGGCPILNTSVESDDTHPELRKKARAAIIAWKDRISTLIKMGIDNKEFRSPADIEGTALTIVAAIEGAIMISKVTGKSSYLKAVMKSVKKIIEDLE